MIDLNKKYRTRCGYKVKLHYARTDGIITGIYEAAGSNTRTEWSLLCGTHRYGTSGLDLVEVEPVEVEPVEDRLTKVEAENAKLRERMAEAAAKVLIANGHAIDANTHAAQAAGIARSVERRLGALENIEKLRGRFAPTLTGSQDGSTVTVSAEIRTTPRYGNYDSAWFPGGAAPPMDSKVLAEIEYRNGSKYLSVLTYDGREWRTQGGNALLSQVKRFDDYFRKHSRFSRALRVLRWRFVEGLS